MNRLDRDDLPTTPKTPAKLFAPSIVLWLVAIALYILAFRFITNQSEYKALLTQFVLSDIAWRNYIAYVALLNVALLAPGSAIALILAVLPVFGPDVTFLLSVLGGVSASIISHQLGWHFAGRLKIGFIQSNLARAREYITRSRTRTWVLAMLTRGIPNPLYDTWGYAFGALRIPLTTYLPAATLGGVIAIGLLCYLPSLFLR